MCLYKEDELYYMAVAAVIIMVSSVTVVTYVYVHIYNVKYLDQSGHSLPLF